MHERPRHDPGTTPALVLFDQIGRQTVSPHETTPAPRPRSTPGRGRGRRADPGTTPAQPTNKFTAHTCRKCSAITIAGTTFGLRVDLEPQVLTDETEYAALLAGVPTYDLWPDRTARRRHLEEIAHPERVPRHAHHTCGTTNGTPPPPPPLATSQADPTGPAPF
jgi:hypothetical protein